MSKEKPADAKDTPAKDAPVSQSPAPSMSAQAPSSAPPATATALTPAKSESAPSGKWQPSAADVAGWLEYADEMIPLLNGQQRTQIASLLAGLRTPRQLVPQSEPSPYKAGHLYLFRVSYNASDAPVGEFVARDDLEAWAFYCEQTKRQPSPKSRKIECLGEAEPNQQAGAA